MDLFRDTGVRWIQFLTCYIILVSHFSSQTYNQSHTFVTRQGIYDKVTSAKQEVVNTFYKQSRGEDNITIGMTTVWIKWFENIGQENQHVLRAANHTYLLRGQQLFQVQQEQLSIMTKLPSLYLKDMDVQLVQITEWLKTRLLLVCFRTHRCTLFIASHGQNFAYRQSISDSGNINDAKFFEQQNNLFLAVLYQAFNSTYSELRDESINTENQVMFGAAGGRVLTMVYDMSQVTDSHDVLQCVGSGSVDKLQDSNIVVKIYRWNLSLDLESTPSILSTASTIIVFNSGENALFILGCSERNQVKFPSQVWCRKPNGNMYRVQYLQSYNHIIHFAQGEEHFLLVPQQKYSAAVYWWEGNEFIEWINVDQLLENAKVFCGYNIKNTTFFIFTNGPSVKIYAMVSKRLEKVFEQNHFMDKNNPFLSKHQLKDQTILKVIMYEENKQIYIFVQSKAMDTIYMTLFRVHIKFSNRDDSVDTIYMTLFRVHIKFSNRDDSGAQNEFQAEYQGPSEVVERLDRVFSCLGALEIRISAIGTILPTLLLTNEKADISVPATVSGMAEVRSGKIWNLTNMDDSYAGSINKIVSKILILSDLIDTHATTVSSVREYRTKRLIYEKDLIINYLNIKSLITSTVNDQKFSPDSILLLGHHQSIQRLNSLKTKIMEADTVLVHRIADIAVQDMLLNETIVRSPVRTNRLLTDSLQINSDTEINKIPVKNLTSKTYIVKTNEEINTIQQVVSTRSRRNAAASLQLPDDCVIGELIVDDIDEISVTKLLKSVYINVINNVVNGNLYLKNGFQAEQLTLKDFTEDLSGAEIPLVQNDKLILNQSAQFQFYINPKRIPVYNNFTINYQYAGTPLIHIPQANIPWAPTSYQRLPMMKSNTKIRSAVYNPPFENVYSAVYPDKRRKNHIEMSYKNKFKTKVKILGNLKVHRLLFENSLLNVSNKSVPTSNMGTVYWTYKSPQVIPIPVHFSQGISLLNDLENPIVNGKNFTNFATRKSKFHSLILENIHIVGNASAKEDLVSLSLSGREIEDFRRSEFKVKHIHTKYVNRENAHGILLKDDFLLNELRIVTGNMDIKGSLQASLINEINVQEKLQTAVMIDKCNKLSKVIYNVFLANSAEIEFVNNYEIGMLFDTISNNQSPSFTVSINENLHLSQLAGVTFVNGKSTDLSLVVNQSQPTTVYGRKHFLSQVSTNNLEFTNINGKHIGDLYNSLLRSSSDQIISGFFTIRNASIVSLLDVNYINEIMVQTLIYINQPHINITGDLQFKSLSVKENLTTTSIFNDCVLPKVEPDALVFDSRTAWSTLEVIGDSAWPHTPNGRLHQLLDKAVTTSTAQIITGNIVLMDADFDTITLDSLNGKSLDFIIEDSLSKKRENQIMSGKKEFTGSIKCNRVKVEGDVRFASINSLNIEDLDSRLVRHTVNYNVTSNPISGHKKFISGFTASTLESSGGINGITHQSLAKYNSLETLPPLYVRSLLIDGNIQTKNINGLHIDKFINECVKSNFSEPQLIIGQFHVQGNVTFQGIVTTPNVNNITDSELIFTKSGKSTPSITRCKKFSTNIFVESNFNTDILNGEDVSTRHKNNLKRHQNLTLDGSLELMSNTELMTVYAQDFFVGSNQLIYLNTSLSP